jgi:hypothetical protein
MEQSRRQPWQEDGKKRKPKRDPQDGQQDKGNVLYQIVDEFDHREGEDSGCNCGT